MLISPADHHHITLTSHGIYRYFVSIGGHAQSAEQWAETQSQYS